MCVFGQFSRYQCCKWRHLEYVSAAVCNFCHDNHCMMSLVFIKVRCVCVTCVGGFAWCSLCFRYVTIVDIG